MAEQDPYEFFEGPLCGCLDEAYRFASIVLLDTTAGRHALQKAYHELGHGGVQPMEGHLQIIKTVLRACWKYVQGVESEATLVSHEWMKPLSPLARASLIGADLLGLSIEDLQEVTQKSANEIRQELGLARKALMIQDQGPGGHSHSDDAIEVLADLEALLNEEMSREEAQKKCGSAQALETILEDYQLAKGRFQVSLHHMILEEDETVAIQELVRGHEKRLQQESDDIESISFKERLFFWGGRFLGLLVLGGLSFFVYNRFLVQEADFDAVQALAYESLMLEEDDDIDFPADTLDEIDEYFIANHEVDFKVNVFTDTPRDWRVEGASVIDYEITQIAVTWFKRRQERLFHFVFPSHLVTIENSVRQDVSGFYFYSFASDQMNLILWQQSEGVFAILSGRESVENLVAYVMKNKPEEGRMK